MSNAIKKSLFILCAVMLLTSLAACSGGSATSSPKTPATPTTSAAATPTGDDPGDPSLDDSEPLWWNGFDFGPNLEYAEEYIIQGDPGEYLNVVEAAKQTFDTMRDIGSIPEYSDDTQYTMTLVDLRDIEGEECYVYRLDVDEPTGTIGAAYAYAYQSGNIYMEGYGGQFVGPMGLE